MPRHIGTCFRFYMQMWVENNNKAFAYRIYSHFTQQCTCKRKPSAPTNIWSVSPLYTLLDFAEKKVEKIAGL